MRSAFLGRVWWQQVLIIAAASISYIQLMGLLGTKVLVPAIGWGSGIEAVENPSIAGSVGGRFARWDSGYYLGIAQDGYQREGIERAFFPLYPMLIRFVGDASGMSLLWSGLLVSISCLVCAFLFLYGWVLIDYPQELAIWAVMWLACFPMAFFFVALYSEALFLALSLSSVYFARRGQFIASGVAIALAGATRPTAFLLAIPYFVEYWQQREFAWPNWARMTVGAGIAPLGAVAYSLSLAHVGGKLGFLGIYLLHQSSEFRRFFAWPWRTLYDGINSALLGKGINPDWFSRATAWQDLSYALLGLASGVWGLLRLRLSAALFLLVGMVFFYATHGPYGYAFWSIPRWVASLFPVYLVLALLTAKLPRRLRWLLFLTSMGLLGVLSAWFASGRWVA